MGMSIQVNDFQWEPGKNDAEYIKLLESSRNEWQKIAQKAIAKLKALSKAQEPRVMTLEEAKSASGYVFIQSRSCNILELQLIKDGFVCDSFTVPIAVDDLWWEGYNKHWRLWTSIPTDEQMEAVKWE